MIVQKEQIFDFLNNNPVFYLATAEGDEPRVRAMLLYRADASGILFHTGPVKEVYGQILRNPNVQMCFYNAEQSLQIRVRGALERVDDQALKEEVAHHPTRVFMQAWRAHCATEQAFYEMFEVFRLKKAIANVWTFDRNFAPKEDVAL